MTSINQILFANPASQITPNSPRTSSVDKACADCLELLTDESDEAIEGTGEELFATFAALLDNANSPQSQLSLSDKSFSTQLQADSNLKPAGLIETKGLTSDITHAKLSSDNNVPATHLNSPVALKAEFTAVVSGLQPVAQVSAKTAMNQPPEAYQPRLAHDLLNASSEPASLRTDLEHQDSLSVDADQQQKINTPVTAIETTTETLVDDPTQQAALFSQSTVKSAGNRNIKQDDHAQASEREGTLVDAVSSTPESDLISTQSDHTGLDHRSDHLGNPLLDPQTSQSEQSMETEIPLDVKISSNEQTVNSQLGTEIKSTAPLESVSINPANSLGAPAKTTESIINQVVESLSINAETKPENQGKQLVLHLNPAELGKLEIHLGNDAQQLTAQIVASELVTSELLNREKGQLIETIREMGIDLSDVEVSYHDSSAQRDKQEFQSQRHADRNSDFGFEKTSGESDDDQANPTQTRSEKSSLVDLVA